MGSNQLSRRLGGRRTELLIRKTDQVTYSKPGRIRVAAQHTTVLSPPPTKRRKKIECRIRELLKLSEQADRKPLLFLH